MRSLLLAAVSLSMLAFGCGGRMNPDDGCPEDRCADGGPDTGVTPDGGDDVTPDTTPGACGYGPCTVGTTCRLDCNTCSCLGSGEWGCTAMACLDSGPPPPPPPPPPCPSYAPPDGSYCYGSASCTYPNGCGGMVYAYCGGSRWSVKAEPCSTPTCPASEPIEGTACKGPTKCGYSNGCGGMNTAVCEFSATTWKIYRGDCPPPPPPPPPACPTTKPVAYSPCSSPMSCNWSNGCGAITYGYCDGKYWNMKEPGCVPGCPSSKPVSGAACKPGSVAGWCHYISIPGTSCESQCFCADDGRWACMTPPCAGTGTK